MRAYFTCGVCNELFFSQFDEGEIFAWVLCPACKEPHLAEPGLVVMGT